MAGDERDVQILSKAFEKEKRCQTKEEEPRTGVWGEAVSIRGGHHRDKGAEKNKRLRDPKFIFSRPKGERPILLSGRNAAGEEVFTLRGG